MTIPKLFNYKRNFIEKYGQAEWVKKYGRKYQYIEGTSLDTVVRSLRKLHKEGKDNYYAIFNGQYLFSFNVTYDRAVRKIYGISINSYLRMLKEQKAKLESMKSVNEQCLRLKK